MWRGPLAYGQATADRTLLMGPSLGGGRDGFSAAAMMRWSPRNELPQNHAFLTDGPRDPSVASATRRCTDRVDAAGGRSAEVGSPVRLRLSSKKPGNDASRPRRPRAGRRPRRAGSADHRAEERRAVEGDNGVPTSSPTWSMPAWWRLLERVVVRRVVHRVGQRRRAARPPSSASSIGSRSLLAASRCGTGCRARCRAAAAPRRRAPAPRPCHPDRPPGGLEHLAVARRRSSLSSLR